MVGAWGKTGNRMGKMDGGGGGAVLKLDLKWVNQLLTLMQIWLISHKCIYVPSLKLFLVFRFSSLSHAQSK